MLSSLYARIGSPESLRAVAIDPVLPVGINAHIHLPPNFSAFASVAQAIDLARAEGIGVLGASNYYDFAVYEDFARQAQAGGIFPLFGLEVIALLDDLQAAGTRINDPGNPGKLYLCGKGITGFSPSSPEASALLDTIRQTDAARMARVIDQMAECFAAAGVPVGLNATAVRAGVVARHGCPPETVYLQERHAAQAFQEALFADVASPDRAAFWQRLFGTPSRVAPDDAAGIQNELRSHLMKAGKPAYVAETFVGFEQAYRLILTLGGIPCYPTLADGAKPICAFEEDPERLIGALRARGIFAAEFIPVRNDPAVLTRYVRAMRDAGMIVTAGTEHNTLERIPLTPSCLDGQPIPAEIAAIFEEGACVIAAHQYLRASGEPGYVTDEGALNPAYPDPEARIAALHRLGAAALRRFST